MSSLSTYINRLNEEATNWVAESPDTRFASKLISDLSHWNEMGIFTAEDLGVYLDKEAEANIDYEYEITLNEDPRDFLAGWENTDDVEFDDVGNDIEMEFYK